MVKIFKKNNQMNSLYRLLTKNVTKIKINWFNKIISTMSAMFKKNIF